MENICYISQWYDIRMYRDHDSRYKIKYKRWSKIKYSPLCQKLVSQARLHVLKS